MNTGNMFSFLKSPVRNWLRMIAAESEARGLRSYLVGGFVRDLILRRPNSDLDVVIQGDALGVARALGRKLNLRVVSHDRFGTASLELPQNIRLDFATARRETYPCPGSLPVVSPGTLQDDLFRRDFTINAMAVALKTQGFGELVDLYDGWRDLLQGRIRVLHEKSFFDDPTRIIRAVRFEQRFGFSVEPRTLKLLGEAVRADVAKTVKPARYFEAFRKALKEPCAGSCLIRMARLDVLDFLKKDFPCDLADLALIQKNIHAMCRKPFYREHDWSLVYLLALMSNLDPRTAVEIGMKFQCTRREQDVVGAQKVLADTERQLQKPGLKPSGVYDILSGLPEEAVYFLFVMNPLSCTGRRVHQYLTVSRRIEASLKGDDLTRLGVSVGPQVGKILHQLRLQRIDGLLRTKSQEISFVRKWLKNEV